MEAKGLESLIPKHSFSNDISQKGDIFYLDVNEITPNPYQPRKTFSEENLKSLAQSIKDYGILEPLIVTEKKKKTSEGVSISYQLIAGERRLSAAKMAGLKKVPVIVKKLDDQEKLEISLIENIQRENLNPIEKAEAFQQLMSKFHLSLGKIAKIWGKSKGAVSNSLRLLDLPKDIQEGLKQHKITEGHAKIIAGLKVKDQESVYKDVLDKGLNVRETERLVQQYRGKKRKNKQPLSSNDNFHLDALIKKIKNHFSLGRIDIKKEGSNFKIVFVFPSLSKLREFLNRFLS